jgi:hypothetical protein
VILSLGARSTRQVIPLFPRQVRALSFSGTHARFGLWLFVGMEEVSVRNTYTHRRRVLLLHRSISDLLNCSAVGIEPSRQVRDLDFYSIVRASAPRRSVDDFAFFL